MLPSFYQACLQAQLSSIQFITLQMLVALLQKERRVSIERLATLFAQPILFESRRRNLQRFLLCPKLTPQALWFPILKHWLKQHCHRGQRLKVVIDRTQWRNHNLLMVSLVYKSRTIPLYWIRLSKQGQSNLSEQQTVLCPVLRLLHDYELVLLGDREFHSVALAHWCNQQNLAFVLRLPKSTTVQWSQDHKFERLDELPQFAGMASFEVQVKVTQQKGFGKFNLATRWKRVYRSNQANQVWYLLTNLDSLEDTLALYRQRFAIEPMFRDFKSGGYDLESCHANAQRLSALLVLIAIAYTSTIERGVKIRRKQVGVYVARVKEPHRTQQRHSCFWIGLYGQLWIGSMDIWSEWAEQLMQLKPQKRPFFLRGLRAMYLIESTF